MNWTERMLEAVRRRCDRTPLERTVRLTLYLNGRTIGRNGWSEVTVSAADLKSLNPAWIELVPASFSGVLDPE